MKARFITHPDFAKVRPISLFHKESAPIPIPSDPYQNRHILFRKKISLSSYQKATLHITADDYYKLYVNGRFVTQGPSPSYPHCYYYNEIDLTPYLLPGENTFAVHTYYQGLINRVWVSGDMRASFWFSLTVDGQTVLVSDESWLVSEHTAYSSLGKTGYDTTFLECYDSASPECDFYLPTYNDSHWQKAAVFENADYLLHKQPTKQLTLYDIPPQTVKKTEYGMVIDFGREAVGYLHAVAHGNRGDCVILRFAEELDENDRPRFETRCQCRYEEKWLLSGKQDILIPYDYKAFRYVELIFPDSVTLTEIAFRVRHYPFPLQSPCHSDDPMLTQILTLCANTVKYGTGEVFTDCPTREKGQYLGDVAVAARAHAVLTKDTAPIKKAILDFCHSSFVCPGLLAVSGASYMQEIADYSLIFPALVAWVYAMDGDLAFVHKTLPYVEGIYRHFIGFTDPNGLLENVTDKWNLVDWPPNLRDSYDFPLTNPIGSGLHNVLNAHWCGFLSAYDELLTLVNKPLTQRTESTKQAFIHAFYNEKSGLFSDTPSSAHSAVHSSILPLLFDIGTDDPALKKRLINRIAEKKLSSMGVYMAYFALAALVKHGEKELAIALACDENCWLHMLKEGATTTFEAWGKEQKWNCSLFHPWATAPIIVFTDGIRPY